MGFIPEDPGGNDIRSRLRPRVTKNLADATEVKTQTLITQATQHEVKIVQRGVGISLATEVVKHTEGATSETLRKVRQTTTASRGVGTKTQDTPKNTEDSQDKDKVTLVVIVSKEKIRKTKGKKKRRIFMPRKGRSAYEKYTKVPWRTTPYPDFHGPSPEDCEKVCALLEGEHGRCPRPADIPPPSLDVAGCGQVRQVIDAIVRTVVSANTTFENADKAIKRLYKTFGTVTKNLQLNADEYPGLHHCLDYNRIRSASAKDVANAVRPAGSQELRAKCIKRLLDGTYKINADRAEAFRNETVETPATVLAADQLSDKQKQSEIWMFDNGILHLEHYRALSNHDAMCELVSWDGVAVKTAACVMLFCMQQPVFALDTHCIRLASWLGWTPHGASAEEAFAHLDCLVPDHLKYPLHQLFIRHGQVCLKCKMGSNEGSTGWNDCVCPLEDLLKRKKKEIPPPKPKKVGKSKKAVKAEEAVKSEKAVKAKKAKKAAKTKVADVGKEDDTNTETAPPRKRGRKPKQEMGDNNGSDGDDDYEEPPKKRARKSTKKAVRAAPHKPQTRGRKSADKDAAQTKDQEVVDVPEAMLNPEKREELAAKMDVDDDSSELSEHSDTEFLD